MAEYKQTIYGVQADAVAVEVNQEASFERYPSAEATENGPCNEKKEEPALNMGATINDLPSEVRAKVAHLDKDGGGKAPLTNVIADLLMTQDKLQDELTRLTPGGIRVSFADLSEDDRHLLSEMDTNHDGNVSVSDIISAAHNHAKTKAHFKFLKQIVVMLVITVLVLCGAMLGASVIGITLTKDMKSEGGTLRDTDGNTLGTAKVMTEGNINTIHIAPLATVQSVETIRLTMQDNSVRFFIVNGFHKIPSAQTPDLSLFSTNGDTIKINNEGISVELADGTVEMVSRASPERRLAARRLAEGQTLTDADARLLVDTYRQTRDAYLKAANELKLATGPYKAARDAYVAATATYTKSLYE